MGTTRLGVTGLAAAVSTLAATFFLDFTAAGSGGCGRFALRLLMPGLLPGGVHFRLLERLRDRLRRGIWIEGGAVAALTTRPLGRRDSTSRPVPSAGHRARPAELSERQGGLCRRSFGHAQASALHGPPSLLST